MAKKATNTSLHKAKAAKYDEFYTQYIDIQKEVEAYLEYNPDSFRNKVVTAIAMIHTKVIFFATLF